MTRTERTLWPLLLALLLLLLGCGGSGDGASHGTHASHASHAADPALAAEAATEHSVYHLPSAWRDRTGAAVSLEDLAGRPRVVAMVYSHCR